MNEKQFLNELSKVDQQITKTVEKLLKEGKSVDIIVAIVNKDLDKYINALGVERLAQEYATSLLTEGLTTVKGFKKLSATEDIINAVGQNLEPIAATYRDTILGYFSANKKRLESELLSGLLSGTPTAEITKNLQANFTRVSDQTFHILTDANINTVVQTSYTNISRISTAKAFEDSPETKFEYLGPVDDKTSDQCAYLMQNQNPDGYTKAEIDAGIETPAGTVNWFGRQPSFNCRHIWVVKD